MSLLPSTIGHINRSRMCIDHLSPAELDRNIRNIYETYVSFYPRTFPSIKQ